MGLILFFIFSLLLKEASPLKTTTTQAHCQSKIQDDTHQVNNSGIIHLTIHHVHGPCSPLSSPPSTPLDILKHDQARVQALNKRLANTHPSTSTPSSIGPETISVPLSPGKSVGTGNYVVTIGLGTPSKSYAVVVDTGSSISWVQCQQQSGPIFDPSTSTTYKSIPCDSTECSSLQGATGQAPGCPSPDKCEYTATYADGSFSTGDLSSDTLTLGQSQTSNTPGFVYGCGQNNRGLFGQAGLFGLSRHPLSLISQLSSKYGDVFSYCLPTSSSTGTLSIGAQASNNPSTYVFTPMYSNPSNLYFLRLTGVTVAGKALPLSMATYTSSPMIIDSGTVITRLQPAVYTALKEAFVEAMAKYTRAPSPSTVLDTCFNGSPASLSVPEVGLVFDGGSTLKLAALNLLFEEGDGVSCLAFANNGGDNRITILGNQQQLTYSVVYDVSNSRIGFAAGGCN